MERKAWIDTAKAFAIFLVVMGHYLGDVPPARAFIYTFHMPLFFFISGLLFKKKSSWYQFVGKRTRTLLLPYFIFSFLKYIYSILKNNYGRSVNITEEHLKFYDIFTWHHYFWFIGVLFLVSIVFFPISDKIRTKKELFILIILCTFCHYALSKYFNHFFAENFIKCFTAMVFYSVGYFISDKIYHDTIYNITEQHPVRLIYFVMIILLIFYLCYNKYGVISINFYHNYFYLYFLGFSGIFLTLYCCQCVRYNKIVSFVGANTIIIYLMESYPQAIFGRIIRSVFHVDNFNHITFGYSIIYTVLTILLLSPVIYVINRYLPFLVGRKNTLP